jgi:pyruvate/2-oxoglutarate dehydrogenase complex dihydrolipoamide acyltransferase (E2) component
MNVDSLNEQGDKLTFVDKIFCVVGAIGAEFLKAFKGYIENPTTMLL